MTNSATTMTIREACDRLATSVSDYAERLENSSARARVRGLIPLFNELRRVGATIVEVEDGTNAARDRILRYLLEYRGVVLQGQELMVISGIGEWARRLRELRGFGWHIASGVTLREMAAIGEFAQVGENARIINDSYALLSSEADSAAQARWRFARYLRNSRQTPRAKLLEHLKAHLGSPVTAEELRYASGGKSFWAQQLVDFRSNDGWLIVSRTTGRPDLPPGSFVLARESLIHADDRISDDRRRNVLLESENRCQDCGFRWPVDEEDATCLEVHKVLEPGGRETCMVLCSRCHDRRHSAKGTQSVT